MSSVGQIMSNVLNGRRCRVVLENDTCRLEFGDGYVIYVGSPWRLMTPKGIALGARDHGQEFGHPEPVDGQVRAGSVLRDAAVTSVDVDELSGDLRINFEGGLRIDIFNQSAAFEGWEAQLRSDAGRWWHIIAFGGAGGVHANEFG